MVSETTRRDTLQGVLLGRHSYERRNGQVRMNLLEYDDRQLRILDFGRRSDLRSG